MLIGSDVKVRCQSIVPCAMELHIRQNKKELEV